MSLLGKAAGRFKLTPIFPTLLNFDRSSGHIAMCYFLLLLFVFVDSKSRGVLYGAESSGGGYAVSPWSAASVQHFDFLFQRI